MCDREGEVGTALVEGRSFMVCRRHFNLWLYTREDISLWAWCRRICAPVEETRQIARSVFCDWIDSMAVGS